MAVGVKSWSTTAANNATASSAVNWAEGQLAPTLNNSARALMAEVAAWRMQFGGISYGGSGNAYTATNNAVGTWSAYAAGDFIGLLANHTNTGAATINVDGLGAKNIVTNDGGALISGDITSGALVLLLYDGTSFQLVGSFGSGSYQPLDATLTALAGVTVAANKLVYATGADAFATTDFTSFARTLVDDADAATARATLGLTIGTHVQAYDADLTTWAGLTPSAFFQTLVDDVDASTARATLGLSIGSQVQAYDADLTTWAGVTPGTGVATALAVAVGSAGAVVVNGGALGTPSSGTLTSATGLPISTGVSGLGTGVATALAINTGSAGAPVLVNGALGTPSSGTLTNATGLPVGGISGLGTGVATFLATPSSANLISAVTDETGSGALVFGTSPTFTTATTVSTASSAVHAVTNFTNSAAASGHIGMERGGSANVLMIGYGAASDLGGAIRIDNANGVNFTAALTKGGVAVPTISSTDTLSNKTLSSPTLSGTVAGTFQFSGIIGIGVSPSYPLDVQTGVGRIQTRTLGSSNGIASTNTANSAFSAFAIDAASVDFNSNSGGTLTKGGVAIPTISSTDTLSNKTLSSPTLSGTVSGSPTYSGLQNIRWDGGASVKLFLDRNSASTFKAALGFSSQGSAKWEIGVDINDALAQNVYMYDVVGGATRFLLSSSGLQINSVAVPTISSTDTLTNKTLSSPTLSGTVAGSPTFSGSPIFTAAQSISFQRSAHDVWQFVQGTPGSTRGIGFNNVTDGVYSIFFSDTSNNVGIGTIDPTSRLHVVGGGVQVGAPTGGDKGAGTANFAGDIYKNDTAFTNPDYVFEHFYRGEIVEFAANDGASEYAGLMPLDSLRDFTRKNLHLPQVPKDGGVGIFERGDYLLRAMEENTLYILALHEQIENLNQRLKELEAR
jgi:hypothetical protein